MLPSEIIIKWVRREQIDWDDDTFQNIEWEAHGRAANRHHKLRATLNMHLGNFLPARKVVSRYDKVKHHSDCLVCNAGTEICAHVYHVLTEVKGRGSL